MAELFRVSLTLNAVNVWRIRYMNETDPTVREFIKQNLLSWPQINDALFFLLILGFFLGNLFYATAMRKGTGLEKWISILLFVWAGLGLTTILREFLGQSWINFIPDFLAYTYQPFVRIMIAVWLWKYADCVNASVSVQPVTVRS
ncbi:hypothetical protein L0222_31320 [bacterium]|nr:hypothetical protein [bacterium]